MRILSLYDKGNGGEIVATKEIRKIEIQVETVGTERARKYLKQAEKDESDLTRMIERESKKRQKILEEEQIAANKLAKRTRYSRRRLKTAISQESVSLGGKRRIARTGPYKDLTKREQSDLANQMWDGRARAPFIRSRRKKEHIAKFRTMFRKGNSPDPSRQNTDPMAKYWGKASGDWTKINESNSAFNNSETGKMKKARNDFSKMVRAKTGLKRTSVFGKKDIFAEDNPIKEQIEKAHIQALKENAKFDRTVLAEKKRRFNSVFKQTKSRFGKKSLDVPDSELRAESIRSEQRRQFRAASPKRPEDMTKQEYFDMMSRKFKAKQQYNSKSEKQRRYENGMGYHQNSSQFKNMESIFEAAMNSPMEPKFRRKFVEAQKHQAGLGYHQNTPYFKRMSQKFEQQKEELEQSKVGRAFVRNQKTSEFIDETVVKKKSDAMKAMKDYYTQLERKAKEEQAALHAAAADKSKRFNSIFKTGDKQKFGTQEPRGAERLVQRRIESYNKAWKDVGKGALDVRNSFGSLGTVVSQAIGELTMFAGALTMVGFMATAIFQKMLSVGDAFASIETDFTTGAAFRHSLYQTGGIKSMAEFDRANALNQKYSGLDQYKSAAMLARAGTQIREMKGSVNESTLSNLSTAAYGAAAITGDDAEKTMQKVLEVAKKGKGTDKLGLAELKLTKNMDENLEIIASAIKKDPIASAILRRGTVSSAMERIRNAPKQLLGNVFGQHREQATGIFNRIGNTMMKVANDPEVIQIWSRALTNLENVVDRVFTEENMKAVAMGGAQWGAELAELAGKAMDFAMWFAKNSDLVLTMTKWFVRIWGFISAIKLVVGMGKLVADLYAFGGAIAALKATLAGGGAAGAAGAGATGVGKTIIAGAGAAATKASKLLSPFLSRKLLFGTGLGFFMNSTEVGSGEEDLLAKYNLSKQVGSNVYDLLDLRNSVGNTVNSNNGMGVYDYTKPMPSQSQPMPAWNNPNAKVIVLNDGDVVIDSKLGATELYLQDMGGL